MDAILAIDQGTTSSRAMLFSLPDLAVQAISQAEFPQHFPASGEVEHAPNDLWTTVLSTAREALAQGRAKGLKTRAIGITNQRETTLVWDRKTGRPVARAIVWQDRRTAAICDRLEAEGHGALVAAKTGLRLDPYFSATKIAHILDAVEGARSAAERGELAFGTVDTWLIWQLTGGKSHLTDATNASRTLLYDIRKGVWDADLCALFRVPMAMLPEVRDCADTYGTCDPALFGEALPITGVAGDQQAASIGQGCFRPGMIKATYGTGCFALLNTGTELIESRNRLLTTIATRLSGKVSYALEGSIFVAGAVVQWLRDGVKLIENAPDVGPLAAQADLAQDVILVPAFTGLGAPYWNSDCRGAVYGLTRASGPAEMARAALRSIGFQTRDLIEAIDADWKLPEGAVLRVDGGMARSDQALQGIADLTGLQIDRPAITETTARGAAYLAALQIDAVAGPETFFAQFQRDATFAPKLDAPTRDAAYARWKRAVAATIAFSA